MAIDLYYYMVSPFCRSVLLTARALGIEFNMKEINIFKGEQHQPEYLAINPQHNVPTMVDGDVVLWESRAILTYLVSRYGGKDNSLYPEDPKVRARVDSMLYFDMGTLFARFFAVFRPLLLGEQDSPPDGAMDKVEEALGWLDGFLTRGRFVAGTDHVTVADHALVAVVSGLHAAGLVSSKFENVEKWLVRCTKEMPGYEQANGAGARAFGDFAKSKFNK
ncbi:glutathione S-transferase 1-1-like isoform X3 [Penaeus japonicus]|uniref:glutathione S-transferase 1-1-like isoform X1 n=1 Tax=Penaeus japonicus TaxID=27405 RepID=UPI001C71229A|nr:glutathione S-transferase 1-1-like isoform X1 [Penaeus japonicus]XP_042862678.1 glutathione S-transferase 1-1-like isoform X2 [Penaeus japonicus]XP_042862679.1 glutathione S-transferase 1-1-like isoform X3 [Penaeus japonicus]